MTILNNTVSTCLLTLALVTVRSSPTLSVRDAWMAEESLIVPAMDSRQCREDRIHRIYRRRAVAVVDHHLGRYTCRG